MGATAGGRDLSRDPISQKLSPAGIAIRVTFNQSCACNVWTHSVLFYFFSLSYIHMLYTVTHTRVTFNYHHSGLAYIGAVTREKIVRPTTLARVKKRD